jgi:two-component system sensor histidine kinase CpxA
MRTLFAKILLWFWCTVAITVIGSAFLSALSVSRDASDAASPVARMVRFQLEEARVAYETGGRPALAQFLENVQKIYHARGILVDQYGRDLVTGRNRADLLVRAQRRRAAPFFRAGPDMIARSAADGRYWYFYIVPAETPGAWFLTPDHLFMMGAAVLLCYWLALEITKPVRALQKAVERFGRGDLTARVNSQRRDELGQLARTFDRMAERIETLLAAERRLLLDISHELRSPLARLGVAVELARSGEDLEAALNRIQKESDRLNSLVGQLLQVTRAEGDPNSLRRNPVRLDVLLEQLVEDARIEAAARGCSLAYTRREPVTVKGDPELLRRAVENVIRNAIRYSPKDSEIEIGLVRENGKVLVDVRDRGPGVPDEALPRLFDPFYRVETDRDRASGGIGLGLSIARRAIELHKGIIRARNAHPGLEVELQLPVAEAGA